MSVYVGQTALKLVFTLSEDITGATPVVLKYRKPDGTESSFPVTVTDDANGVMEYEPAAITDIDQAGIWHFWPHVTFSNGDVAASTVTKLIVITEGNE